MTLAPALALARRRHPFLAFGLVAAAVWLASRAVVAARRSARGRRSSPSP